jgi:acetylglutamate kinase
MKRRANESSWTTAQVLSEALPFIQRHAERTIVVKFGGHAMGDEALTQQFANDIVLLRQCGLRPVVVHGGGPQIGSMLKRLDLKSEFVDGLRVTDKPTVDVAEMVLSGTINKSIVAAINQAGGRAVGLSGRDAGLIKAEAVNDKLGFTGRPVSVDPLVIHTLAETRPGFIPVISPISGGENGESYNVNADTAAGVIAGALNAARLMLLTDIEGVMDADKNLLTDLSIKDAEKLIKDGVAVGGMIPKLNTAIGALNEGVEAVVILDGRRAHGLLVELFTDMGAGTLIR